MANNFNIPSCQAVWNFEPGSLLVDSMGKQIDLASYSPGSPSADATCKEGAASALFARSAGQHLYTLDEDLPAGFPLKSDYSSKLMTICFWLRMTTAVASGQVFNLITKGLAGYDPSLGLQLIYGGVDRGYLVAKWGLTASTEYSYTHSGIYLAHSTWYHIAVRINGTASKILKMRIAVDGGSTYDATGAPSDVLRLSSTRRLVIGAKDSGSDALDGRLDELLFFNDLLSDAEVVSVKGGTFDFGDARLVSRFRFESGALTADSKGTAVLKVPGVDSDASDYRFGSGCLSLTGNSNLRIPEASLSSLFPWKSTDTWRNGGVCGWFKFYSVNNGTLFAKHATATGLRGVRLYLGAANRLFYTAASSSSGQQEVDTGIVVVPGRWYFIGFTFDGRNVTNSYYWFTVYVYDSVTDTVTVFGPSRNTSYGGYLGAADWSIGSDGNGANSICAKIDQLAVFDEWLFTPELAALKDDSRKGYNDVLTDVGLQAYWGFEDIPGSLIDEKNATTLQAVPAGSIPAVGTNGLWRKSWEKGASFTRGVTGTGTNNYFSITDANLQAGFPFKSGDTTKLISVTFWIKPESRFPGPRYIFGKWSNPMGFARSFALVLNDNRLYFYYAQSGDGYTTTLRNTMIDILPGEWYHVSCALDGVAKTLYIKVVKASDSSVQTDTASPATPLAYAVHVSTTTLYIGNQDYGSTTYPTRDWLNFHGLIDEVAVFAEKVDETKMDSIRAGGYDYAGDAACKALWLFESGALTTDSKGTNTLTAAGTPVASTDKKQGSNSVLLSSTVNPYMMVEDAALPANFPLKFGAGTTKFSVCGWVKMGQAGINAGYTSQCLFVKGQPGQFTFAVYLYSSSIYSYLRVYWGWGGGTELFESPNIYPPGNRWLHFSVAVDIEAKSVYMRLYDFEDHDLPADASFVATNDLWIGPGPLTVGGSMGVNTTFSGVMDELQFFNRILSTEEMELLQSRMYEPLDMQKVHHLSGYYEYGPPNIPLSRIFPVPHPRWRQQSQMGRRVFPVVK